MVSVAFLILLASQTSWAGDRTKKVVFGVDARCMQTSDVASIPDFKSDDELYFGWKHSRMQVPSRSREFTINKGIANDESSMMTNLFEIELENGESLSSVLSVMESDGGFSAADQALLAQLIDGVLAREGVPLPVEDIIAKLIGDGHDVYGVIKFTITNRDGNIELTTDGARKATKQPEISANRFHLREYGKSYDYTVEVFALENDPPTPSTDAAIQYFGHVERVGDIPAVTQPAMCGTEGQSKRLEGIQIDYSPESTVRVPLRYRGHFYGSGNSDWVQVGNYLGSRGLEKQMEAIWVEIADDSLRSTYDVYYSSHIAGFGWTSWSKNGQMSGTTGCIRRIEAVRIYIARRN